MAAQREAADELGDHAELDEVFRLHLGEDAGAVAGGFAGGVLGVEADLPLAQALADDVFEADERAAADEEDLRGVHLDVLLLGMLAAALRGDVGDGAFEHFEQGLLHAFAADVAGDGDVAGGFADLVDFVDVDDAALGGFEIVVGVLQELEEDVLDVFTDVAGFGERGGVADGERDVEHAGERLGQQRFAASRSGRSAGRWTCRFRLRPSAASAASALGVGVAGIGRGSGACSDCGRRRRGPSWRSPGRSTY